MVRVWFADTAPLLEEKIYRQYYQELPAWRREKADKYCFAKGKAESVGVWILWSRARAQYELPEDAVFNLSHSGGYALCAFSDCPGAKVGCDVEEIKEFKEPVAQRFFCRSEYAHIMDRKETDRLQMFYRYWVLKESFMKATRQGMALDMSSFEIGWDESDAPVLIRKPPKYPEEYFYKEYTEVGVNARIAVCATDREIDGQLHILRL